MSRSLDRLPDYLKKYCVTQHYAHYSEREHASWRFIMQQNTKFFAQHAVPIYLDGLKKTGIPLDRIPRIDEMDQALSLFGWGAVAVEGFIPPAAFLEFQAHGCLPIATDMRTLEHISYTPAPDIVHEAAGHAPIIADPEYAAYLRKYAAIAQKAIISSEDVEVYEAIRLLSDLKENPDTKPGQIDSAETALVLKSSKVSHISEASRVARMAWWTVEYGLLGSESDPKIYGAGLLSSIGESQNCLSKSVRKIPLSLACVETSYDITRPQPQLFVAPNIQRLTDVLEEFDRTMSYRIGGKSSLDLIIKAASVCSTHLDSGVAIGGKLESYELDPIGDIAFLKFSGPCQVSFKDMEISGQGRTRHPEGFSSPIGRWSQLPDRRPADISQDDLRKLDIQKGQQSALRFTNGFLVQGTIADIKWKEGKLILLTWDHCKVARGDRVFYQPEWGLFDMVVGSTVTSVHGGPPDKNAYGDYQVGRAKTHPGRRSPYGDMDRKAFDFYRQVRELRDAAQASVIGGMSLEKQLSLLAHEYSSSSSNEWLIGLEILEIAQKHLGKARGHLPVFQKIKASLDEAAAVGGSIQADAIKKGMNLLG